MSMTRQGPETMRTAVMIVEDDLAQLVANAKSLTEKFRPIPVFIERPDVFPKDLSSWANDQKVEIAKQIGEPVSAQEVLALCLGEADKLADIAEAVVQHYVAHGCRLSVLDVGLPSVDESGTLFAQELARRAEAVVYGHVLATKQMGSVTMRRLVRAAPIAGVDAYALDLPQMVAYDISKGAEGLPPLCSGFLDDLREKAQEMLRSLTSAERLRAATVFGGSGLDLFHHRIGERLGDDRRLQVFFDECADTELRTGEMPPCTVETLMSLLGHPSPRAVQAVLQRHVSELRCWTTSRHCNFPGEDRNGLSDAPAAAVKRVYEAERAFETVFGPPSLTEAAELCCRIAERLAEALGRTLCCKRPYLPPHRLAIGGVAELEPIADNLVRNACTHGVDDVALSFRVADQRLVLDVIHNAVQGTDNIVPRKGHGLWLMRQVVRQVNVLADCSEEQWALALRLPGRQPWFEGREVGAPDRLCVETTACSSLALPYRGGDD